MMTSISFRPSLSSSPFMIPVTMADNSHIPEGKHMSSSPTWDTTVNMDTYLSDPNFRKAALRAAVDKPMLRF